MFGKAAGSFAFKESCWKRHWRRVCTKIHSLLTNINRTYVLVEKSLWNDIFASYWRRRSSIKSWNISWSCCGINFCRGLFTNWPLNSKLIRFMCYFLRKLTLKWLVWSHKEVWKLERYLPRVNIMAFLVQPLLSAGNRQA